MAITISAQTFVSLCVCLLVFGILQGALAYSILLERKIVAWVQDRIGPNRVGPMGLFQPIADGIKLLFKEDFVPQGADRVLFLAAPLFLLVPALVGWAIVPWGGVWESVPGFSLGPVTVEPGRAVVAAADVSVGIVYVLATAGVGVYGVVLGGWASNSKYSALGGLRASAQMLSYEIPMGISILIVLLMAGSLRPVEIIAAQAGPHGTWNILAQPMAAVILFTSMLAEANRAPFDLAEAEQELVGGYHTEYSGMRWAMFFFGEYSHMITSSAIFAVLFLGGWGALPFVPQSAAGGVVAVLFKAVVFAVKVAGLVCLMMVVRWTLPRFRYDQLMNLAWRCLIPLAAVLMVGTAVLEWRGFGEWYWMLGMNVVVGGVVYVLQAWWPRGERVNRRLAMEGSRFNAPGRAARGCKAGV